MMSTSVQKEKSASAGRLTVNVLNILHCVDFRRVCVPLFFFIFYFIFLLSYIDPSVIFSSNGINIHTYVSIMHAQDASSYTDLMYRHLFILELTPEYLQEIAVTPGGFTRLAVTLCIYACHDPVAGALTVTALALFFNWIFVLYIQAVSTRRPFLFVYAPSFLLLTICAWYELSYCSFLLPVAGALAVAVLYQRFRSASFLKSILWLSIFFWITWYLMQWGCLLLLIFIIISEFFSKERSIARVLIASIVNCTILCFVDTSIIPLNMAIRWSDFTMMSGLPLAVILFFPIVSIIFAALNHFRHVPVSKTTRVSAVFRTLLLVFVTTAVVLWLSIEPVNRDTRTVARTVHHVMNGQWEAILKEKTEQFFKGFPLKSGTLQVFMIHAADHALCRTGQSGEKLFTFPQAVFSNDPLLNLQSMFTHGYVNWVVVLDLAMELGMVNTAEKIAGEIMENMGPYPDILYRRALVQIAKGNSDAGAVYLNKLANMPFYRAEAGRILDMISNKENLNSEPRIASMVANMDTTDYFLDNNLSCDFILRHLLQSNPGNRAAFDYLMTYYLLYDRPDQAAALVPMAYAFGYTTLPRYWEEAVCLYQSVNMLQGSDLSFSGLRQETIERFLNFTKAWVRIQKDPDAAVKLKPAFGESYFFYSMFKYTAGVYNE